MSPVHLPVMPPVEPMLARPAVALPEGDQWSFEPKWDGFRAVVFRDGTEVRIDSRNQRPLGRYFPELIAALRGKAPDRVVLDGEVVVPSPSGALDFDALQARLHPAESRVERLARETPASFVVFDILAFDQRDLRSAPFSERRRLIEAIFGESPAATEHRSASESRLQAPAPSSGDVQTAHPSPDVLLTPASTSRLTASEWFGRFEGAGFDGLVAKSLTDPYLPGQRAMVKVKHRRTADVVVAGFRWKSPGAAVASLVLGLFDQDHVLHHVGVASSFTDATRRSLAQLLQPLDLPSGAAHPWVGTGADSTHGPGPTSRWSAKRDLSFTPLRLELVAEVAYDQLQGRRFRHSSQFVRWRPDRRPDSCTYDQLDVTPPAELASVFARPPRT